MAIGQLAGVTLDIVVPNLIVKRSHREDRKNYFSLRVTEESNGLAGRSERGQPEQ